MSQDQDYRTEFERAMRGCRRRIQERQDRQQRSQGESNEPVWSDVPDNSVGRIGE